MSNRLAIHQFPVLLIVNAMSIDYHVSKQSVLLFTSFSLVLLLDVEGVFDDQFSVYGTFGCLIRSGNKKSQSVGDSLNPHSS